MIDEPGRSYIPLSGVFHFVLTYQTDERTGIVPRALLEYDPKILLSPVAQKNQLTRVPT